MARRPDGYVTNKVQSVSHVIIPFTYDGPVRLDDPDNGVIGMMPVYRTKAEARKRFGKNVDLRAIWLKKKPSADGEVSG